MTLPRQQVVREATDLFREAEGQPGAQALADARVGVGVQSWSEEDKAAVLTLVERLLGSQDDALAQQELLDRYLRVGT